ncbi:MAG: ATP-dependent DNA ligase [Nitrospiria bacterium]
MRASRVVSATTLARGVFPPLPVPLPIPYPVMESTASDHLPPGDQWQFEPKWDGFRCLIFRWQDHVVLQSKAGQPLTRYFPELVTAVRNLRAPAFVLDGEIVVAIDGRLSFDHLLQRIHPAESRIRRLAGETPAGFMAFDLLYEADRGGRLLVEEPLRHRRARLTRLISKAPPGSPIRLSPATEDRHVAEQWLAEGAGMGLDGIMAKTWNAPYRSGERDAMIKIKRVKTADCVVGGFRYTRAGVIGSLLLGLYDDEGYLHHVGHTSAFTERERRQLPDMVEPLKGGAGFTGRAPGGPSRWSTSRSSEWEPLAHRLICEVSYNHFAQDRFRHGAMFLRWRPEKDPKDCTLDQVRSEPRSREPRVA